MQALQVVASAILTLSLVPSGQNNNEEPSIVTIIGRDYTFVAPDTIPDGLTTFVFRNEGKEPHEAILVRIPAGHSAAEAFSAMSTSGRMPRWVERAGGPNVLGPGLEVRVIQSLLPGTYVWFCVVAAPDGVSHSHKGMIRSMTVVPSNASAGQEPAAGSVLSMDDFVFLLSEPLQQGNQWLRVENIGKKPHELVVLELNPGTTLDDLLRSTPNRTGPRPLVQRGGIASIAPGDHAYVQLNMRAGNYVFRCRIHDEETGRTHRELGMESEFIVQ